MRPMKTLVATMSRFFNCSRAFAMQLLSDSEYRQLASEASAAYYADIQVWEERQFQLEQE